MIRSDSVTPHTNRFAIWAVTPMGTLWTLLGCNLCALSTLSLCAFLNVGLTSQCRELRFCQVREYNISRMAVGSDSTRLTQVLERHLPHLFVGPYNSKPDTWALPSMMATSGELCARFRPALFAGKMAGSDGWSKHPSLTRIVNRNHLGIQIAPLGHSTGDQRKKQPPISRGLVERSPFITECA